MVWGGTEIISKKVHVRGEMCQRLIEANLLIRYLVTFNKMNWQKQPHLFFR